jgi:hypothetical protein
MLRSKTITAAYKRLIINKLHKKKMSMPKTQPTDNQPFAEAFLGLGGHIYKKARQAMGKSVITGIYAITNPLGQTYIGQAVDWEKRQAKYKRKACERQPKIYRSLKRFGVEQHVFTLLTECDADFLDDLEADYKYRFVKKNGWENALFCRIDDRKRDSISTAVACSQYTKEREWVADFASLAEGERATGIHFSSIGAALKGRRKTAGGFLWAKQGEPCPEFRPRTKYRSTPVAAYNSDNQLVGTWDNSKAAAQALGLTRPQISVALNNETKTKNGLLIKRINN